MGFDQDQRVRSQLRWLAVLILIPSLVAVGGGITIAWRAGQSQKVQSEVEKLRHLGSQAKSLSEILLSEIETLRVGAQAILQMDSQGSFQVNFKDRFFSKILYWAELETDSNGIQALARSLKNPDWGKDVPYVSHIDDGYILGALKNLNFEALKKTGMAILRFKQDPSRANQWLALIFLDPKISSKALFVLVDPATVFSAFEKWRARSEGGSLRSYLVGSDGYVLNHSVPTYIAADFSRTALFREAVRHLFSGDQLSGAGSFRSIDQATVLASYLRLDALPLGLVVEKLKLPEAQVSGGISFFSILIWTLLWAATAIGAVRWIQKLKWSEAQSPQEFPEELPEELSPDSSPFDESLLQAIAAKQAEEAANLLNESLEQKNRAQWVEENARLKFTQAIAAGVFPRSDSKAHSLLQGQSSSQEASPEVKE